MEIGSETYIKGILDTVIFILKEFQPISSHSDPIRLVLPQRAFDGRMLRVAFRQAYCLLVVA